MRHGDIGRPEEQPGLRVGSSFKAGGGDRRRVQGSHDCVSTIAHSRQAAGMGRTILEALKDKPVKGMPLDNGPGFAEFQKLEGQPNAPIFFAEPHKPWQRGCSGNAHGLLRYFFPRGCNFLDVSQAGLGRALGLIGHRPRKRLNWRTLFHVFFETVALA